jgi:hypothetical protein
MVERTCSLEGCTKKHEARGLCNMHYMRLIRFGDPGDALPTRVYGRDPICSVAGCDRPRRANGLCEAHNTRVRKWGDARADVPIAVHSRATPPGTCTIDGCSRPHEGHGLCQMHNERRKRNGDPLRLVRIMEHPETCTIDGCDRPWASNGMCDQHRTKTWARNNPIKRRALKTRRKARIRGASEGFVVTEKDLRRLLAHSCLACGGIDRVGVDHIIPVSRGGRHVIGNLRPLCHWCNSSKGARTWMEWRVSGAPRAVLVFGTR